MNCNKTANLQSQGCNTRKIQSLSERQIPICILSQKTKNAVYRPHKVHIRQFFILPPALL